MPEDVVTLLIGISGPSSSGKTTLARLLRDIWPSTFILHEDDFYWSDAQIPIHNGVQDWDCLESLDLKQLQEALAYVKTHGTPPPNLESKEDKNSVGESGVDQSIVDTWHEKARETVSASPNLRIAIMDGFLLYSEQMNDIWELLDMRLFLRADYATVKRRREARSGYVTLEGFWEDPPGYVDQIVWPNYVNDHAFLFVDGDVAGTLDEDACRRLDLKVMPHEFGKDMTKCMQWACEIVESSVREFLAR